MSELRHPLTVPQQKQVAALQEQLQRTQGVLAAYAQAIADGVDAAGIEHEWKLDGTDLVGTPKPSGPALVP